jgi:B12-binding domain/radical SAM domain protein
MLYDFRFDVERMIASLEAKVFGIDFHWLPHVQGALEVGRLLKKYHPQIPLVLGGFSASYYAEEILKETEIDFVIRGDSAEEPLRILLSSLNNGQRDFYHVPNLSWRTKEGKVIHNHLSYVPEDLDQFSFDYRYIPRSTIWSLDFKGVLPFLGWLDYPIMAALTCRGCTHNCITCGGSASAYKLIHNRQRPAYRNPRDLVNDIWGIRRLSQAPIFILGDLRQAGMEYAHSFLKGIDGKAGQVIIEFFSPADREYIFQLAKSLPNFTLEITLESHDPEIRQAFGRYYTFREVEEMITAALEAGCQRLDIFFMIGLPKQTYKSVIETTRYAEELIQRFNKKDKKRVYPFISPLAPFIDPGSLVFENPEVYGYRIFYRRIKELSLLLKEPSWKYILNYQTKWLSRDEIVDSTYEAGLRLNRAKRKFGLLESQKADEVEKRINLAQDLIKQIDKIKMQGDDREAKAIFERIAPLIKEASLSTVCEKSELNLPIRGPRLNFLAIVWQVVRAIGRRIFF